MEQKGKNLHCELNNAERQLLAIKNQPVRYFLMIKKVENKLRVMKNCPELSDINNKIQKKFNPATEVQCLLCLGSFIHKGALKMHSRTNRL